MINAKYIVYIISSFAFLFCVFQNKNIDYELIFLLPFSLLVMSILCFKVFELLKFSIVFNIFLLQAIIRYCAIPFLIASGDDVYAGWTNTWNGNLAVFIMTIEIIVLFIALTMVASKQSKAYFNKKSVIEPIKHSFIVYAILLFMIVYIYQSGFLSRVNFFWEVSGFIKQYIRGDGSLQDVGFAGMLFTPFRILVALFLISRIFISQKLSYNTKIALYCVVLGATSFFMVGTSRFSMLLFAVPILVLMSLIIHEKTAKKFIIAMTIVFIPAIIFASIQKFTLIGEEVDTLFFFTASSLDAYFSGVGSVAVGFDAYENLHNGNHFLFFINDTFQNVPGLSQYTIAEYRTTVMYNRQFYGHFDWLDQIVPLTITGIFHFGVFGFFFFYSVFFMLIALYMERKSYKEAFLGYKFIYISLSITLSLVFMLNIGSMYFALASTFLFVFLPLYAIHKLNFRIRWSNH